MTFTAFLKLASRPRKRRNVKLILAVAQRMRRLRHEDHYDQSDFYRLTKCGTTGCLALHTVLEAGLEVKDVGRLFAPGVPYPIRNAATNLLGLSRYESQVLFSAGTFWPEEYRERLKTARDYKRNRRQERPSRVAADLLQALAERKVQL